MSGQQRADAEMGSDSRGSSGSPGGGDALRGLKFGKKVHFEGLGVGGSCGGEAGGGSSSGVPASSSGMPTSALGPLPSAAATPGPAATAMAPRRGKGVLQGGQAPLPPRCQVEGCGVDLTGVKAYYCRHKVCGMHSKAPTVVVAGLEQRFCQQCSRI